MSVLIRHLTQQERLNFLLTNRIPRQLVTRLIGWYSRLQSPLLTKISIALWQKFSPDLDFSEAREQQFDSLQSCFIRQLKPGVRPIDKTVGVITSPCDAIIGCCGRIADSTVFQAKGYPYEISELIPDAAICQSLQDGCYVTLRLKSSMYHRFHAPTDCSIDEVQYISGDTWNVNPVALKRVQKLYCKNERAVLNLQLKDKSQHLVMVPVAAILVASMKFHCLDHPLDLRYRGSNILPCHASYRQGDEMGYFQHGSTIILFASSAFKLLDNIRSGDRINMGEALLQSDSDISL